MANLFVALFLLTGTAYAMGAPGWLLLVSYVPLLAGLWLARRVLAERELRVARSAER